MTGEINVAQAVTKNILLEVWQGPYGGVPPLAKVKVNDFKPALEEAMALNLKEVEQIASQSSPPTFKNTIEALEQAGAVMNRVRAVYEIWQSTMATKDFQDLESEMDPKIAAFNDQISQNLKLFKRIESIYLSKQKTSLSPEQQRLTMVYYDQFVRQGAQLSESSKAQVTRINQKLASLYATFNQNLLADETNHFQVLSEKDLKGLPQSAQDDAAAVAAEKGLKGQWVILNTRSSAQPFLTYADSRAMREKVWRAFVNRGDNGDEHDNNKTIQQILQLRFERAKLLGYATHAHWRLSDKMAKTPEKAMDLMMQVWPATQKRVQREVDEMLIIAKEDQGLTEIAPWDYRYYAEKVRKKKYDLDMNQIKAYLQLDKIREAMFWAAGHLYGLQFTEISDVPLAQADIRVWRIEDASKNQVGLWYFDPFARPTKKSGAWMSEYRTQQTLHPATAIVSNNTNFVKGRAGEPVLISWDDAVTLFHEFGHALHGLISHVTYPSLAGTNVATDYVEFPSQINENWLTTPEILSKFAVHYQTGKAMPEELITKLHRAAQFNQGFQVAEYLSAALVDMKLHLADPKNLDPDQFERQTLKEIGMPKEIVMRHRTPQFGHLFSSDGYSAGYYSYLWSEVLDHDAFGAFLEASGPFDKVVAKKFKDHVLSVGNSVDPAQAYRAFRGRDAKIDSYLRAKGF